MALVSAGRHLNVLRVPPWIWSQSLNYSRSHGKIRRNNVKIIMIFSDESKSTLVEKYKSTIADTVTKLAAKDRERLSFKSSSSPDAPKKLSDDTLAKLTNQMKLVGKTSTANAVMVKNLAAKLWEGLKLKIKSKKTEETLDSNKPETLLKTAYMSFKNLLSLLNKIPISNIFIVIKLATKLLQQLENNKSEQFKGHEKEIVGYAKMLETYILSLSIRDKMNIQMTEEHILATKEKLQHELTNLKLKERMSPFILFCQTEYEKMGEHGILNFDEYMKEKWDLLSEEQKEEWKTIAITKALQLAMYGAFQCDLLQLFDEIVSVSNLETT